MWQSAHFRICLMDHTPRKRQYIYTSLHTHARCSSALAMFVLTIGDLLEFIILTFRWNYVN